MGEDRKGGGWGGEQRKIYTSIKTIKKKISDTQFRQWDPEEPQRITGQSHCCSRRHSMVQEAWVPQLQSKIGVKMAFQLLYAFFLQTISFFRRQTTAQAICTGNLKRLAQKRREEQLHSKCQGGVPQRKRQLSLDPHVFNSKSEACRPGGL